MWLAWNGTKAADQTLGCGTGCQQWPSLGSKREVRGQGPQLQDRTAHLPQQDSARNPRDQLLKAEATFPPFPPGADPWPLTPDPFPPRGPHHAVGKSKPIGVGDDLQEDVHGIQYVRQDVIFAIFTDNLQERTEQGQGEGREALLGPPLRLNKTSAQPVAAGRRDIRPLGTSFVQNQKLGF